MLFLEFSVYCVAFLMINSLITLFWYYILVTAHLLERSFTRKLTCSKDQLYSMKYFIQLLEKIGSVTRKLTCEKISKLTYSKKEIFRFQSTFAFIKAANLISSFWSFLIQHNLIFMASLQNSYCFLMLLLVFLIWQKIRNNKCTILGPRKFKNVVLASKTGIWAQGLETLSHFRVSEPSCNWAFFRVTGLQNRSRNWPSE